MPAPFRPRPLSLRTKAWIFRCLSFSKKTRNEPPTNCERASHGGHARGTIAPPLAQRTSVDRAGPRRSARSHFHFRRPARLARRNRFRAQSETLCGLRAAGLAATVRLFGKGRSGGRGRSDKAARNRAPLSRAWLAGARQHARATAPRRCTAAAADRLSRSAERQG